MVLDQGTSCSPLKPRGLGSSAQEVSGINAFLLSSLLGARVQSAVYDDTMQISAAALMAVIVVSWDSRQGGLSRGGGCPRVLPRSHTHSSVGNLGAGLCTVLALLCGPASHEQDHPLKVRETEHSLCTWQKA